MESAANARRQRRLVERGSDRLPFITGQARSLPSDPYPDLPLSTVDVDSSQLSERQPNEGGIGSDRFSNIIRLQKAEPSDLIPEIQPTGEPRGEKPKDNSQSNEGDLQKSNTSSLVPEIQLVNETPLQRHDDETIRKKTSSDGGSVSPNQSNENAAWSIEAPKEQLNFTPYDITQAITATKYNRFLASIVITFLVVLSNWGLDIGGTITRVLVGTRPLLFLIITNITIVLTLLMENKDPNAMGRSAVTNLGSDDSLGQMLEVGLLVQRALGALLMDCSVSAVIMVCFLGF